jgi:hypothetical protein
MMKTNSIAAVLGMICLAHASAAYAFNEEIAKATPHRLPPHIVKTGKKRIIKRIPVGNSGGSEGGKTCYYQEYTIQNVCTEYRWVPDLVQHCSYDSDGNFQGCQDVDEGSTQQFQYECDSTGSEYVCQ